MSKALGTKTWEPGFLASKVSENIPSLQRFAAEIVSDPWFAESTVKFWWPSLMGQEVSQHQKWLKTSSSKRSSHSRGAKLHHRLSDTLVTGLDGGQPFNGRDLIVELLTSPWFRLLSLEEASPIHQLLSRRLLTPEELEENSQA